MDTPAFTIRYNEFGTRCQVFLVEGQKNFPAGGVTAQNAEYLVEFFDRRSYYITVIYFDDNHYSDNGLHRKTVAVFGLLLLTPEF